jgi:hypothetical protein
VSHQIIVIALPATNGAGCSHCETRYSRLAPPHPAHWLLQWHPRPSTTVAWTACGAVLEHALQMISTEWDTFLLSDKPPPNAYVREGVAEIAKQYGRAEIESSRTLGDALPAELARVRDQVMPGLIAREASTGLAFLRADMDRTARAMIEGDVIAMIECFLALQAWQP